jgi:two-component system, sensor histidine kinase and response regulator
MENEKVTILIIDDREANIYAVEKLLEKPGRIFLRATDGKTGLKLALDNEVDLILLDVQMPEMDGFEVAQILKSNKRTKDIPIIFASAEKKERSSVMKGFEEGAVDYLSKPLDPELTKAKVSVLLKIQIQKKQLIEKNISLEKAEAKIKLLNENLQQNLQQIEAANKELESFSYSVSHDLRAPLRSILGYAQVLEEDYIDKLGQEARQVLSTIQQNAVRMNALIDDLLEFARLGKQELQKSEVNTEKLVECTVQQISTSTRHNAEVIIKPLMPAYADYSLLNQVWMNLISNAIKYSAKKDKPLVEIGSRKETNEVVFYIMDNGTGFDMEYVHKLFGVFQRLHKADEFEGTGVGLALVQRIVNRHGGRVWAEGKIGEGATFYFTLPDMSQAGD